MNVNSDSNISSDISNIIASSISKLNLNTASRAFEADKKANSENIENNFEEEDKKLAEDKISQNSIDVEDIQKYALSAGETLSIDDINYGLMYGRSVIADYSA